MRDSGAPPGSWWPRLDQVQPTFLCTVQKMSGAVDTLKAQQPQCCTRAATHHVIDIITGDQFTGDQVCCPECVVEQAVVAENIGDSGQRIDHGAHAGAAADPQQSSQPGRVRPTQLHP